MKNSKIFIVGPMGTGKTTVGRMLAKRLHYDFLDTDHALEKSTGTTIQTIFDIEGEEGFRTRESDIIDKLTQKSNIVLATGGGAVLKAGNRQILSSRGFVIYLKSSAEILKKRMYYDKKRPLLQGKDKDKVIEQIIKDREPLYEEVADLIIHTKSWSLRSSVQNIIRLLRIKNIIK